MPTVTLILPQALQPLALWERDFGFKPHAPRFKSLFNPKLKQTLSVQGIENTVLLLAGLTAESISLAAWRYAAQEGQLPTQAVLCADLVQLESGLDCVRLLPDLPAVSEAENEQVAQLLNSFLAQDGLHWQGIGNYGYLLLNQPPSMNTTPLSSVVGQNIFSYLPQGEKKERLYWHRLLNEIQMLLHTPQLGNSGFKHFNGMWLWGNGERIERLTTSIKQIIGKGLNTQTLAYGLNAHYQELPKSLSELDLSLGDTVIILDDLVLPSLKDDPANWQNTLSHLEQNWLDPLIKLAQQKKINLQVSTANGELYSVANKPFWKFWS
ncbi:MAG: hypothetical protein WAQ53_18030 [Thiofilum sp.]|uniref:hypothetical protein n=1 Tax=Thiofilum sp. TaxID=2212733 RepID=UPI0025E3D28E|nr:hypothetical protein [Thiofilum sp.]MBK8453655.1 hypothetical protein [Thiofilum sp.]